MRYSIMIETEMLKLRLLTACEVRMWAEDLPALEGKLGCKYMGEPVEGIFRDIILGQAEKAENDEANCAFHSFWLVIRKTDNIAVGSFGFKHPPNENCEVEIGYGLGKVHEGNGYMTEAVAAICKWAKARDDVDYVIAETESHNP